MKMIKQDDTKKTATSVVTFHDRGFGREHRRVIGGKVVFRENAENEMLYPALVEEVEKQISQGLEEGFTSDPCYPDWYVKPQQTEQASV